MSSIWVRTWESTPKIDCGLCGRNSCSSFSRAVLVGDLEVAACPILRLPEFVSLREELETNRARKMKARSRVAPDRPKNGVLYTRPCKDTDERLMAELRVHNGIEPGEPVRFPQFDPLILCDMLECLDVPFEDVKCSRELGYGRIKASEMSITVLRDGRVNIRRVESKESVAQVFQKIERVIIGSVVCECCGCDLLSILAGCRTRDIDPDHPVLAAGSSLSLNEDIARQPLTRGSLEAALGDSASTTIETIDSLHNLLVRGIGQLADDGSSSSAEEPDMDEARCTVARLMQSHDVRGNETVVLKALSILSATLAALDSINDVGRLRDQLDEEGHRSVQSYIERAKAGLLTEVIPATETSSLLLCYAHLNKVNRAIRLLNRWDHS